MSDHDAGDLRQQLAALIARGDTSAHQQQSDELIRRLHELTGIDRGEILETAYEDAADQLIEGDQP